MWSPELVLATARAIQADVSRLLPAGEARDAERELTALLARADAGEEVVDELLACLRARAGTRDAAFTLLRGERVGSYRSLLGAPLGAGGRYACPVSGCEEKGDRLDDSEPEPRCPDHSVRMQRL